MDHTRKWVLSPTGSESNGITSEDLSLILSLHSSKMINEKGELLGKNKDHYIPGSSIYECLIRKNHAKYFPRFLELKSVYTGKTTTKEVSIPNKSLKRKKSKWEMNDD